jgi:hypothetical protein
MVLTGVGGAVRGMQIAIALHTLTELFVESGRLR